MKTLKAPQITASPVRRWNNHKSAAATKKSIQTLCHSSHVPIISSCFCSRIVAFSVQNMRQKCNRQGRCRGSGEGERYLLRRRKRWRSVTTAGAQDDTCQWPGSVRTHQNSCFVPVRRWQRKESETLCVFPSLASGAQSILRFLHVDAYFSFETLDFNLHTVDITPL